MRHNRGYLARLGRAARAGCDIPTEAPIFEQRWILPVDNTTISVSELLPSGVTVDGNDFAVSVDAFSTSRSLGDLCPSCAPLQGLLAPSPAFTGTLTMDQSLPADIAAATIASASAEIAIHNGFSFDPIAGGGSVTATLTDGQGGAEIGEVTFSAGLPPGQTTTQTLTVAPGAIGSNLFVTAVITSPGGQVTTIDNEERLTITATPGTVLASAATVDVASRSVTIDPVDLDVEDIDETITDRIESGSIVLTIANPFGVSVGAQLDIDYPGGTIAKQLSIGSSATSTATLSYSGAELRTFLGKSGVRLTGTGTVSSSSGAITVTPGQQVVIDAKIDITLRIGD